MIKPHKKFIHDELKAAGLDTENSLHIIQNYKINSNDISHFSSYFISPINTLDYVFKDSHGKIFAIIIILEKHTSFEEVKIFSDFFAQHIKTIQGFCPFIYFINQYEIGFWDSENYPIRKILSFHSFNNLEKYKLRNGKHITLSSEDLNKSIANRPYQIKAINKTLEHFNNKNRSALWVMATGTGKTRTVIALIDILVKQEFVSKVLILVDRKELAVQMQKNLKKYLPNYAKQRIRTTVFNENKVIYVSTYQTMIKLINKVNISQGFFDLIIADECHRSIYKYYGQLFLKFDALKLGLTATPIDFIDRDTFNFFEVKNKRPVFQYSYNQAIEENYLCPFEVLKIQEKNNYTIFEPTTESEIKEKSLSTFRQYYTLNDDRYEKIINTFLTYHYRDPITYRPRKSIFYVTNKIEAYELEKMFNKLANQNIAKAIVSGTKNISSLIQEFAKPESEFNVAISVDILTTGIDIPNIVNLVFARPIYSYVTFWQMIGRGTRLYDKEFKKERFYIFDIFKNFEYFKLFPKGIEPIPQISLTRKLFNANLNLLQEIKENSYSDILKQELYMQIKSLPKNDLFIKANMNTLAQCSNINPDNFQNLANISELFDRVQTIDTQDVKFRIKIKKLQFAQHINDAKTLKKHIKRIVDDIERLRETENIEIISSHNELLEKVRLQNFWHTADFTTSSMLVNVLAPLMKYTQRTSYIEASCYFSFEINDYNF